MVPLIALILLMGLYPRPILTRMEPSINLLLDRVQVAQAHLDAEHARALAALAVPARTIAEK
jgi:NADH:ubiquinone oxidoreductase subunit 4 (subunit M)